ncbi:MAG: ATP-binding domain-containing protein, partial [Burkholderiales bacterium]
LHVCFNRPLADHFARIAPPGGEVMTFHGLCQQLLREAGLPLPAPGPGRFEALEAQALALMPVLKPRYDTLVVDEGQDFSQPWCDLLMCLAHPKARVLWLDDPMQALYPRAPAALQGWPVLRAQTNHRSPREIVEWLRMLLPEDQRIESASPLASGGLELIAYGDRGPGGATDAFETVQVATREAVRRCLAAGFRRQDIAVISFHGRAQSALLSLDSLGTHAVRRFTGRHDLLDQPVYTEGGLLFESVYRFKGQAAPAVVLTEIDFRALDAMALRKLFVGATRATIKLVLVAAPAAAQVIGGAMQRSQP